MLEMTSNFRISFDLVELATFIVSYGLQTADKAIPGYTKGPFPAKRRLKMIASLAFFSENLTLQNIPGAKLNPAD